jgi:hypothetical protein
MAKINGTFSVTVKLVKPKQYLKLELQVCCHSVDCNCHLNSRLVFVDAVMIVATRFPCRFIN